MEHETSQPDRPRGGLQVRSNTVRRWRWTVAEGLLSAPVRCKREQWYLTCGFPTDSGRGPTADLLLRFLRERVVVSERRVELAAVAEAGDAEALLGWVQAPEGATHLQVRLLEPSGLRRFKRLVLHPVADRDPKCHPLANVPRWSRHRPAFPIERVVLPSSLEALVDKLHGFHSELSAPPRSLHKLAAEALGAAWVIDGSAVRAQRMQLSDLERIAAGSWVIVDLETFSTLVNRTGRAPTNVVTHTAEHEIMSARVEYGDVPTRGFALQDVIPYATLVDQTRFQTRVLRASRAWKQYAGQTGFATLLASETPWEKKCGDVLSAARPVGQGKLIVTDLPWLVAGRHGRLLAPRVAEHLLRMHLGGPISDAAQYWNRWDDCGALVRDVADLPRRYPPLRAVRWASANREVARLGIVLPAVATPSPGCHLMLCTGRIDQRGIHDGIPPEPMVIFMKWLAREVRERARWATRCLGDTTVIWQFDTADGLKYAAHYESASGVADETPVRTLIVRTDAAGPSRVPTRPGDVPHDVLTLPADVGVFGDSSLAYQANLTRHLRTWIERARR